MSEWLAGEIARIQVLIQASIFVVALAVVVGVYAKTRAVVPTLGALLFGFVVVWAVNNADWFDAKIDQEFNSLSPPAADTAVAAAVLSVVDVASAAAMVVGGVV